MTSHEQELSLRKYTTAPLTWEQLDNNFELLKQKANSLVDDREVLTAADATISSQVSGNATNIATNATAIVANKVITDAQTLANAVAIQAGAAEIATNAAMLAVAQIDISSIQVALNPFVTTKILELTEDWSLTVPGLLKAGEGLVGSSTDASATHLLEIQEWQGQGTLNVNGTLDVDGDIYSENMQSNLLMVTPKTKVQTLALATPSQGWLVYCSDGHNAGPCLAVYNGLNWKKIVLGDTL
jgi:hypothetical protein